MDSNGGRGTLLALQEKLLAYRMPPAASHQFQHSPLSGRRAGYSDYRYDLTEIEQIRYLDFFYSGAVDLIHETEDIELITDAAQVSSAHPKAVYASCDYHVGSDVLPAVADALEGCPPARRLYAWLFRHWTALALRFLGNPESMVFPLFSEEQLTHATYVSRGRLIFAHLDPPPSFTPVQSSGVQISLNVPLSYSAPRPRSVLLFRDGRLIRWEVYAVESPEIEFTHIEQHPESGTHLYQLCVPSKFLSSPMIFRT